MRRASSACSTGRAKTVTVENVLTFVHLAEFYGITQLLRRTEALLEAVVTVGARNCCAKLAEATQLRCGQAAQHCRRVLLSDFAAAITQAAFTRLELGVIAELLEADELVCEREEVALDGLMRGGPRRRPSRRTRWTPCCRSSAGRTSRRRR